MSDLDRLSREVAAAGDGWMVPGVSGITPDGTFWRHANCGWFDDDDMPASEEEGDSEDGGRWCASEVDGIRPNLRDPVTVNALLGNGEVWSANGIPKWAARIGDCTRFDDLRTFAIARAWIAAKGKGNGN